MEDSSQSLLVDMDAEKSSLGPDRGLHNFCGSIGPRPFYTNSLSRGPVTQELPKSHVVGSAPAIRLGEGNFLHRTGYAMSWIFVTYHDSGHKQFDHSELVCILAAPAFRPLMTKRETRRTLTR